MTNPKEVLSDFDEKFSYNGEPKVVEPYERLDYDQWVYIKQFIISSQISTLTSQLEAIPEDEPCPACNGRKFYDDHDSPSSHSEDGECLSCPIKVECEVCEATGKSLGGINQERQRQRQALQLAIKEWSELK